jgi:hypothetical protein
MSREYSHRLLENIEKRRKRKPILPKLLTTISKFHFSALLKSSLYRKLAKPILSRKSLLREVFLNLPGFYTNWDRIELADFQDFIRW